MLGRKWGCGSDGGGGGGEHLPIIGVDACDAGLQRQSDKNEAVFMLS
jgi:hypothetical protein